MMLQFHQITYYLTEQLRQIAHYLSEHLIQTNYILYQLLGHGKGTVTTSKVCKRKFQIPAGIPVNSFIRFRPEPESSMKISVPVYPEPESYLKFPVPVMYNGMKIRKIRYPVPVSKSTFRSSPTTNTVTTLDPTLIILLVRSL